MDVKQANEYLGEMYQHLGKLDSEIESLEQRINSIQKRNQNNENTQTCETLGQTTLITFGLNQVERNMEHFVSFTNHFFQFQDPRLVAYSQRLFDYANFNEQHRKRQYQKRHVSDV